MEMVLHYWRKNELQPWCARYLTSDIARYCVDDHKVVACRFSNALLVALFEHNGKRARLVAAQLDSSRKWHCKLTRPVSDSWIRTH